MASEGGLQSILVGLKALEGVLSGIDKQEALKRAQKEKDEEEERRKAQERRTFLFGQVKPPTRFISPSGKIEREETGFVPSELASELSAQDLPLTTKILKQPSSSLSFEQRQQLESQKEEGRQTRQQERENFLISQFEDKIEKASFQRELDQLNRIVRESGEPVEKSLTEEELRRFAFLKTQLGEPLQVEQQFKEPGFLRRLIGKKDPVPAGFGLIPGMQIPEGLVPEASEVPLAEEKTSQQLAQEIGVPVGGGRKVTKDDVVVKKVAEFINQQEGTKEEKIKRAEEILIKLGYKL